MLSSIFLPLLSLYHAPSYSPLVSGTTPEEPVVSKSGHIYERRLVEKYIEANGKDPVSGEPLTAEDLIAVKGTHIKFNLITLFHIITLYHSIPLFSSLLTFPKCAIIFALLYYIFTCFSDLDSSNSIIAYLPIIVFK